MPAGQALLAEQVASPSPGFDEPQPTSAPRIRMMPSFFMFHSHCVRVVESLLKTEKVVEENRRRSQGR
jgi:hypothetical protein